MMRVPPLTAAHLRSCANEAAHAAASSLSASSPARTAPAAPPTAHADESRPAIWSPSATGRLFDRSKILRSNADVICPARGLRVGRQDRRSRERQRDRQGERDFASVSLLWLLLGAPLTLLETASSYSPDGFGPRRRSQECASALKSTVRLDSTAASVMRGSSV